jgi:predicted transcriptional regulator of viral defense system
MRPDPQLPLVFTHAQARRRGLSRHQIAQRVTSGLWRRLHRGAYCLASTWDAASPEGRGVLVAGAAQLTHTSSVPSAVSHASAAAIHGLPVPARLLGRAWLTVAAGHGARTHYSDGLVQEVATLAHDHVEARRGLRVTTLPRTVADCLRHLPLADAVAVADAAVHSGHLTLEALARAVEAQRSWPLAAAAQRALPLVDGRRESPLESRSAVAMHLYNLPMPLCQVEVRDRQGRLLGRADFVWPDAQVVGEADGKGKYQGGDAVAVFEAEKDRQAAFEVLGLVVVRWGARHLSGEPPPFVTRLRAALASPPRRPFTGSLTQVAAYTR